MVFIPTKNTLKRQGFTLIDHKWKNGAVSYIQNNWYCLEDKIEINCEKDIENLLLSNKQI